ncbi:MAG TPA: AAA family ATPase [Candidatus Poseidoniaceae archaeon]|nr:AAA family ATPase [Candidatus Poseidoniaceae archaeon]
MSGASDWTERYRPKSEQHLEGNEVQRRKIRTWLDDWKIGSPKKKALLLVGPPGVGKTTVARAIAEDMGWNVIELNASDARNAAAIRKAATNGATHRSLFHDPNAPPSRTLILLDEVDHLSGGLREVSQARIAKAMESNEINEQRVTLSGDSGGKAELLNLLSQTKQPVILACNDEMGLWGKNSSWRSTRDRFGKHLQKIIFVRANNEALRRIARRVLREEEITFDDSAISALVEGNHGDLRALVRDLQVMTSDLDGPLTAEIVTRYAKSSQRDVSVEIFPGLDSLYRARSAEDALIITRTIDKDPSELLNWVHWNNASLFGNTPGIQRGSRSLKQADKMLMGRYLNTAHRSTYWTQHLSSLAASVANPVSLQGRIFPSYPNFLRRGGSSIRPSIIEKLSSLSGTSKATTREEFLPALMLLGRDDSPIGDANNFDTSMLIGFTAEEHSSLCGLVPSRRSTKELVKAYKESREELLSQKGDNPVVEQKVTDEIKKPQVTIQEPPKDDDDNSPDPGQMKLF